MRLSGPINAASPRRQCVGSWHHHVACVAGHGSGREPWCVAFFLFLFFFSFSHPTTNGLRSIYDTTIHTYLPTDLPGRVVNVISGRAGLPWP